MRRHASSRPATHSAAGRPFRTGSPRAGRRSTPRGFWSSTPPGPSTPRASPQAREAISLIKFHVAGVMHEVVDRAIQVHGALGISDDTVLSWFYRQERAARIYDGPDEVHKVVVRQDGMTLQNRGPS